MANLTQAPVNENIFRVQLVSQRTAKEGIENQERVVFEATPDLSESRQVNYNSVDPVHMPGQMFVYKNTAARTFSLSGVKLVSRTTSEAEKNLATLWLLRSWTMPRFGIGSSTLSTGQRRYRERVKNNAIQSGSDQFQQLQNQGAFGSELLGAPPPVLYFSAYSRQAGSTSEVNGASQAVRREHISRVPVLLQNLTIPYPSDVDYIISDSGVPMPTLMVLDISLIEAHSAAEYERFSLDQYKSGTLPNF